MEGILHDKVRCLTSILEDIQQDIKGREELSRAVIGDLEAHTSEVKGLILQAEDFIWDRHRLYSGSKSKTK